MLFQKNLLIIYKGILVVTIWRSLSLIEDKYIGNNIKTNTIILMLSIILLYLIGDLSAF